MQEIDRLMARLIVLWFALSIALISFLGQFAALGKPVEWGEVKAKASINGVVYALVVDIDGEDYAVRTDLLTYLRYRRGARIPLAVSANGGYIILRGVI